MKLARTLPPALLMLAVLAVGCRSSTYKPSAWRTLVPAVMRAQPNPLPQTAANVSAGHEAFEMYCSNCHNADGGGRRARPSLRTDRVHGETDGEIHWILVNGSKGHGMPAWKSLGDTSLWQLVEYIRSLPPAPQQQQQ